MTGFFKWGQAGGFALLARYTQNIKHWFDTWSRHESFAKNKKKKEILLKNLLVGRFSIRFP